MELKTLNLLFGSALFFIIFLAGWVPLYQRKKAHEHHHESFMETIATGIFLGAALLHILSESHQLFIDQQISYPFTYLIAGLTFLFFLWMEHLGEELYHKKLQQHAFISVAWLMLTVHSFFEGSAVGLSADMSLTVVLFMAVVSHKWAESFAMGVQLGKSKLSFKMNTLLFIIYAMMTPVGMFLGYHFKGIANSLYSPICMAISAGTFMYFGTLHGLERCVMVQRCCNLKHFSYVILGFLLMALVA